MELTKHAHLKKRAVCKVQMNLFAKPSLGPEAEAVAYEQPMPEVLISCSAFAANFFDKRGAGRLGHVWFWLLPTQHC